MALPWGSEGFYDHPYAVRLGTNGKFHTVALDFDLKSHGPDRADEDARIALALLHTAGISAILVQSGPGGGRHVLATVAEPWLTVRDATRLVMRLRDGIGLVSLDPAPMRNASTGAIRPPLSLHRHGGRSEVLEMTTAQALRTLAVNNRPEAFKCLIVSLPNPAKQHQISSTSTDLSPPA